ncbi:MAG: hypothetical protein ACO3ND_04335 [Opitutales bacterium]
MAKLPALLAILSLLAGVLPAQTLRLDRNPAEEFIAKARTAAAKEPKYLERLSSLHFEIKSVDKDGKDSGMLVLQVAPPYRRRQINYSPDYSTELIQAANGLEGWTAQRNMKVAGSRATVGVIRFEEVARLRDMAANDLGFFALPDPAAGTASYRGEGLIAGRKTVSVEYAYKSGFRLVRHFDAQNFQLAATDYFQPDGKVLRQQVEEIQWVDGLAFPKKEKLFLGEEKVAEITYEKVAVNPELPDETFAFPQR